MISHSNKFKKAFTDLGRELYVKILHYAVVYNLETEDEKLILTQNNLELLTEDMEALTPVSELGNDDIISLNKNNLGELFRTYMKSFDLETTHRFNVGDKMIINIGCKVDDDIEYLNYGKYYVYAKAYNEDTKTFTYTLCDKMLFTMIPYDNSAVFENNTSMTCQAVINKILTLCNIPYALSTLINGDKVIYKETFEGLELTYRDVLDMIMQTQGCSLVVDYDAENDIDRIIDKSFNSSAVDTIDENILSDKNIKVKEKFGKINSLLFKRASGIDNIERKDQEAINRDGLCQYSIEDNLILDQENRVDYIDNLFNKIRNIEYYECEIDTIGIGYIEYLDLFELRTPDSIYNCLCLKNTAQVSNGYKENFTTEAPVDTTQEYVSGAKDDKTASIIMDKLKGEIVLKTDSDGKISQVRLDSSGDEGSLVEISGDQIDLTGKNINLTGDDITISSTKFNVDENGNLTCNDATINNATLNTANVIGGRIELTGIDPSSPYSYPLIKLNHYSGNYYNEITPTGMQIWDKYGNEKSYYSIDDTGGSFFLGTSPYDSTHYVFAEGGGTGAYADEYVRVQRSSSAYCTYRYTGQNVVSDKRCKDNITNIDKKQSIDIITNLQPVEYNYIELEDKHRGLIAQDVKEVLNKNGIENEIYTYDEKEDRYGMMYTELIPDLINCVKYQQEQIAELKEEIETLKGGNK